MNNVLLFNYHLSICRQRRIIFAIDVIKYFLGTLNKGIRMKQILPTTLLSCALLTLGCLAEEPASTQVNTTTPTQTAPSDVTTKETSSSFMNMKQDEITSCGLNKLTQEEKAALQSCVKKYMDGTSKQVQLPDPIKLQSIDKDSKTIELADGQKFTYSNSNKKTIANWNVGDFIRVEPGKKKNGYVLFHVPSNKSIKVKERKEKHSSTEK